MRIAAGILMILYGVTTVGFYVDYGVVFVSPLNFPVFTPLLTFLSVVPLLLVESVALRGNIGKYASVQAFSSCFL